MLRALKNTLPHESFIYLGDTARLPYGTKSPDTVQQYASQMARILVERQIKALVIACNTATTAALPHLQAMLPEIPVLGVVRPGATAVVAAPATATAASAAGLSPDYFVDTLFRRVGAGAATAVSAPASSPDGGTFAPDSAAVSMW